jgi:hypothetical protein
MKIHRPHIQLPDIRKDLQKLPGQVANGLGKAAQALGFHSDGFSPAQKPMVNLNGGMPQANLLQSTQTAGAQGTQVNGSMMAGLPPLLANSPTAPDGGPWTPEKVQYCKLIEQDAQVTTHQPATMDGFKYWLEKYTGPCDSGFVTGSPPQMTPTEYWHRRALGWQAGDQDLPPFGPYGKTQDSPLQSADDEMKSLGGVPKGTVAPPGPPAIDFTDDFFATNEIFKNQLKELQAERASNDKLNSSPPPMHGFDDVQAAGDGSVKGDLAAVFQLLDPSDPKAMSKAIDILNKAHPGQFSLEGGKLQVAGGGSVSAVNGEWTYSGPTAA